MRIANASTPVTVLDSPHHGGLGVTRSLGRLGIPVFNVDSSKWTPALFSRYCRGKLIWDLDQVPPETSVNYLLKAGRERRQRSILMPTTDQAAMLVADYSEALKEWYIFPRQNRVLAHSLCNKKEMYSLARKFHIPAPRTIRLRDRNDLLECSTRLGLPVMIKALDGQAWTGDSKTKLIVRTMRQLVGLYESIGDTPLSDLIVQEYIPGAEDTVWMFNGYFNERSECLAGFTGRKIRQCPIYTGVASLGICEENPAVRQAALGFMQKVGYQGIVDIDFRYDARDGEYKVLDVNPRIGSTFRLFVSEQGLDVARAQYLDLTGQSVPAGRPLIGRKWIVEDLDCVSAFRYRKEGSLTVLEWLRSLRGIQECSFFSADDLFPTLMMLRTDILELFRRWGWRRTPKGRCERKRKMVSAVAAEADPFGPEVNTCVGSRTAPPREL